MGSNWKPHVTVAAVAHRDQQYLMVEEIILGERVYNQPAGHLEAGETLLQAVVRETLEETRHPFTPNALVGIYRYLTPDQSRTFLRFCFCGQTGTADALPLDSAIQRAVWLTREEIEALPNRRSPMVLSCINDFESGRLFPLDILHPDYL